MKLDERVAKETEILIALAITLMVIVAYLFGRWMREGIADLAMSRL